VAATGTGTDERLHVVAAEGRHMLVGTDGIVAGSMAPTEKSTKAPRRWFGQDDE